MNRLMLILATISVAALILALAPTADAHGGFGGGNQVFVQASPFGFHQQAVVVQSVPRVFVQSGVVVQSGHAFSNCVFVQQRPQVQVNVNRGFGLFRRNNVRVFVR
jgi:hypothetical protein